MSTSTENIVNVNMNSVDDIESNIQTNDKINETLNPFRESTNILQEERANTSNKWLKKCCVKFLGIIIILLLVFGVVFGLIF
jgi:hypothetical protein